MSHYNVMDGELRERSQKLNPNILVVGMLFLAMFALLFSQRRRVEPVSEHILNEPVPPCADTAVDKVKISWIGSPNFAVLAPVPTPTNMPNVKTGAQYYAVDKGFLYDYVLGFGTDGRVYWVKRDLHIK